MKKLGYASPSIRVVELEDSIMQLGSGLTSARDKYERKTPDDNWEGDWDDEE
jgi:hypothetical protein